MAYPETYGPPKVKDPSSTIQSVTQPIVEDALNAGKGLGDTSTQSGFNPYTVSYQLAKTQDPALKAADWVNGTNKYRIENGKPMLSYSELYDAFGAKDPNIDDATRQKVERRIRNGERLNAIGTFLGNLVNYVRTNKGHMAMNLDNLGKEQQARFTQLRDYNTKLDRQGYADYVEALVKDRAEKARQDALSAQQQAQQQSYALSLLKFQDDAARKNRKEAADATKNAWEQGFKAQQQAETERFHNATIANQRRANDIRENGGGGGVKESITINGDKTYTRRTPLTPLEARIIVDNFGDDNQKQGKDAIGADVVGIASKIIASGGVDEGILKNMGFTLQGQKGQASTFTIDPNGNIVTGGSQGAKEGLSFKE
jgi:hypothetical protein